MCSKNTQKNNPIQEIRIYQNHVTPNIPELNTHTVLVEQLEHKRDLEPVGLEFTDFIEFIAPNTIDGA